MRGKTRSCDSFIWYYDFITVVLAIIHKVQYVDCIKSSADT